MTTDLLAYKLYVTEWRRHTVQSNNAEDEYQGEDQNHNRVDLQSWAFIGVESYFSALALYSTACSCRPRSPRSISYVQLSHPSTLLATALGIANKRHTQHSAAASTSTCSSRRCRAGIGNALLLVGSRTSSNGGLGSSGGCWARGASAGRSHAWAGR